MGIILISNPKFSGAFAKNYNNLNESLVGTLSPFYGIC
jgi:hypothetical protein